MALPKGSKEKLASKVSAELSEDKAIKEITEVSTDEIVEKEVAQVEEEKEQEEETLPKVTFNADSEIKNAKEQNVKVRMKVSHSCSIGGVRYELIKGESYNVPANVKRILANADMLNPL